MDPSKHLLFLLLFLFLVLFTSLCIKNRLLPRSRDSFNISVVDPAVGSKMHRRPAAEALAAALAVALPILHPAHKLVRRDAFADCHFEAYPNLRLARKLAHPGAFAGCHAETTAECTVKNAAAPMLV